MRNLNVASPVRSPCGSPPRAESDERLDPTGEALWEPQFRQRLGPAGLCTQKQPLRTPGPVKMKTELVTCCVSEVVSQLAT